MHLLTFKLSPTNNEFKSLFYLFFNISICVHKQLPSYSVVKFLGSTLKFRIFFTTRRIFDCVSCKLLTIQMWMGYLLIVHQSE